MTAKLRSGIGSKDIDVHTSQQGEYQIVNNPYVLIIGIAEYKDPNESLPAVKSDVKYMKKLWIDTFRYKNVSVAHETIGSSFMTAKELHKYLNKRVAEINLNENCDSLILIYSGHGGNHGINNYIICSDNIAISLTEIYDKFSAKHGHLENKPKIMYIDCCRGQKQLKHDEINQYEKVKGSNTVYPCKLSDIFIHFATCNDYIACTKNVEYGSYLIHAIYECYRKEFENHNVKCISLNETSLKINGIINQNTKGAQTAEISHRLMYDVYIEPFKVKTDTNTPQTRHSFQNEIIKKDQEIKLLKQKLRQQNNYMFGAQSEND